MGWLYFPAVMAIMKELLLLEQTLRRYIKEKGRGKTPSEQFLTN